MNHATPAIRASATTPPTTPPAMAPEFTELDTELDCAAPLGEVEGSIEDLIVAPTRFCSTEAKVGSANPAAGTVDVAPPFALIRDHH